MNNAAGEALPPPNIQTHTHPPPKHPNTHPHTGSYAQTHKLFFCDAGLRQVLAHVLARTREKETGGKGEHETKGGTPTGL